ncbi:MAG TPA: aspartate aminotransferase family protein [Dehalococcoidia bacterium]|nr:aspartate aminotransferase family protein [Dehalococcoidia bacterium]|tara:strand:+ start:3235 stop:4602 length:1368 start_codon:yes stop_codon:yes gene_type:complete
MNSSNDEIIALQNSALEHLWVYGKQPSQMAEAGEPNIFTSGSGSTVTDIHGKTYIDAMSALWLKNVGYGRKEIADAAYEQMLELTYMPSGTTTKPTINLAQKISEITPGDLSRSFFTSGGSESNETAIKIVKAYFKRIGQPLRTKFISRIGSYHGATAGALALGSSPNFPKTDYEPMMPNTFHVPQPNPYRALISGLTDEEYANFCIKSTEEMIKSQNPDTIAAIIAEPISSPMGAIVPPPNYWPMLRELCDKYGCLLIADEVITGFGRTGTMFGVEHWNVVPDIMTVAKGITSGYIPMGAAITRGCISDAFIGNDKATLQHIITFGGHPVAAAASLKNIEIIERENLVDNSKTMGLYLKQQLCALQEKHPIIGDVRGLGLFCAIEIVKDSVTKDYFEEKADLAKILTSSLSEQGVLLKCGNVTNIAPPLCITKDEINNIVESLNIALGKFEDTL